jgi:hypothetical protein
MAIEKMMEPAMEEIGDAPLEIEIGDEMAVEEIVEEENVGFYDNLAKYLDDSDLATISSGLLSAFEADERSRSEWLKTYVDGLDLLGFKSKDRQEPFKGASGVFHPVLAEAVVRFQSNAIVEIFPAAGPVLTRIMGDDTPEKVGQAKRVKEELNYQLTDNMVEYRSETEKLLFRLPLAGSVFRKIYFDQDKQRPCAMMVPAEDLVVDYETSSLDTSERYTHIMRKSDNEVRKLMRAGFYISQELGDAVPYYSDGKEKEDELTGVEPSHEKCETRVLLEFCVHYNLPGSFSDPDGVADPYLITIDKSSGKVMSIYRNWLEGDDNRNAQQYFVPYEYMPGLGFYGFGLIHLIGSIAKASTSILRQLIDAGTLANLPGGLKARGMRMSGGKDPIQPGEWRDADVAGGALKDNIFPLPYKEPSATLSALLGNLIEEGRRIGSIADIEIGNTGAEAPVGTTLALMERSLKVMSAVHARLHAAMRREFKMISRVIFEYMPEQYEWDETGQFNRKQDFDGRVDVIPVSDPNAATQAQKIVQMQAVMQLASTAPELYNMKELHRAGLQAIGIKNDERILPLDQEPPRMDPVQENMAILTSRPVKVYPDQDHTAHLQVHIAAMMDPKIAETVGQSPNAQKLQGQMEAHIIEHLAFQYRDDIQQAMGVELPPLGEPLPPEVEARLSRLLGEAAERVREEHKAEMQQKQAEEIANDPVFQLREREVAIKEAKTMHDIDLDNREFVVDIAKAVAKEMMDLRRIESEETRAGAKIGADLVTFGAQLEAEERRQGVSLGKEIAENIRKDARTVQEMDQMTKEKEKDRQAMLEKARLDAANRRAAAKKSGDK